jgi:hypothetical protein
MTFANIPNGRRVQKKRKLSVNFSQALSTLAFLIDQRETSGDL